MVKNLMSSKFLSRRSKQDRLISERIPEDHSQPYAVKSGLIKVHCPEVISPL